MRLIGGGRGGARFAQAWDGRERFQQVGRRFVSLRRRLAETLSGQVNRQYSYVLFGALRHGVAANLHSEGARLRRRAPQSCRPRPLARAHTGLMGR